MVEAADAVYECRARGIFRKREMTPLAGDHVRFTPQEGGPALWMRWNPAGTSW